MKKIWMKQRKIGINQSVKMPIGYRQKCRGGIGKNAEYNITSININKEEEEKLENIKNFYKKNMNALMPDFAVEEIEKYLIWGMEEKLLIASIKEAVSRNKLNWEYIKSILEECHSYNIKTAEDFYTKQKVYKASKKVKNKSPCKNKINSYNNYDQRNYNNLNDFYANQ